MELIEKELQGNIVTLEPLNTKHLPELVEAGKERSLWKWMTFSFADANSVETFVTNVSSMAKYGQGLGYVIRGNESGSVIGGSGYWHVETRHKKLEIGGSWITPDMQRSGANTEAKYLLLKHAFETMGCSRIGFSIDSRNEKSLRAIKRIGAVEEGLLRNDFVLHDGSDRNSVIFSIVLAEWPDTKLHLESLLSRHAS